MGRGYRLIHISSVDDCGIDIILLEDFLPQFLRLLLPLLLLILPPESLVLFPTDSVCFQDSLPLSLLSGEPCFLLSFNLVLSGVFSITKPLSLLLSLSSFSVKLFSTLAAFELKVILMLSLVLCFHPGILLRLLFHLGYLFLELLFLEPFLIELVFQFGLGRVLPFKQLFLCLITPELLALLLHRVVSGILLPFLELFLTNSHFEFLLGCSCHCRPFLLLFLHIHPELIATPHSGLFSLS